MNADVAKPSMRAVQPTKNIAAMEVLLVVTTAVQRCHSFVAWRSAPVLGDSGIEHTSSIVGITLASARHPVTADVLRLPSATRSSFILANPTWPDSSGSVATYVEILHSVIQERRGGLGEAVSGRKGLGRSMLGGAVVSIGRWE